ncbi:MAG: dockerin type I domain-containing protein [Planctomycetota bacterium]
MSKRIDRVGGGIAAAGALLLGGPAVDAQLVLDDFTTGAFFDQQQYLSVDQTWDAPAAVGGERTVFSGYGGSLAVEPSGGGSLTFDHDRGVFEVIGLRYGGEANPLAADFTAAGERLLMRIDEAVPLGDHVHPPQLSMVFGSGAGGDAQSTGFGAKLAWSDEPYYLSWLLDRASQPIDWSDVDSIALNVFLTGHSRVTIGEIVVAPAMPGDIDGDGAVGPGDFAEWRRFFGVEANVAADLNFDGVVDAADFTLWRDELAAAAPAAIPEPAAAVLLGVLAAAVRRRWREARGPAGTPRHRCS